MAGIRREKGCELDLSVVVPVLNEEGNVETLCAEIVAALDRHLLYEIIFVDDGSTDDTAAAVRQRMSTANVRLIRHPRTAGQSAAIRTGVKAARASLIGTLDGDCQNDPKDLILLYEKAISPSGPDMVIGFREKRKDTLVKRAASLIANAVRSRVLGDHCPDSSCGIRIFRRDAYLALPFFDHMHRFLPALFDAHDHRVESVRVNHRPRIHGVSKYGVRDRLWVGIVDLAGVMWLRRRMKPELNITEEESRIEH